MKIWGLSDLHLHGNQENPMLKFGDVWLNHRKRIIENCRAYVGWNDIVLIPGDLTLVTRAQDAGVDLQLIADIPGSKVICEGNHDFWWGSISKVRNLIDNSIFAIQSDSVQIGSVQICGTRGWINPAVSFKGFLEFDETVSEEKAAHDAARDNGAIFEKEVKRLRLSLESLKDSDTRRIAIFHFPPTNHQGVATPMTDLLEEFGVTACVFGHLHGPFVEQGNDGPMVVKNGIEYHFVSADYLEFKPKLIFGS